MSDQNVLEEATRHEGTRTVVISWVHSASETATHDIGVEAVIKAIRTGGKNLRGQTTQIRNRFEAELDITGDLQKAKLAVKQLKESLPAVMWCGQFSNREKPAADKFQKHSGLIPADFDNLGDKLPEIGKKLEASSHLYALFLSPSGDGLKAIFRVPSDASKHAGSFRAVEAHVKQLTGVQIDESGKDISRLCFMSYDPELYHNPNATELEPLPEPEKPRSRGASVSLRPGASAFRAELLAELNSKPSKAQIREMLAVIPKRPHYHDWITLVAAVGDALDEPEAVEVLDEWSPEEEPGEYAKKLTSGFEKIHVGTLIHLARQYGWTGQIGTPRAKVDLHAGAVSEPLELPPPPLPYVPPPLDLLPGVLQDYVHEAAESLNVDVSFILLPLLSALGSAIGNTRSIFLKRGFVQPPVIWTTIVGRSGSRKSPALEKATFAVMEHERELVRQNKVEAEKYAESLAQWESKSRNERGLKPEPPLSLTCLMDDMTLEALADAMQENPRGVLVKKDELSHWFASFDQYHASKGADVSRWLSLHTGVFFGLDRRIDKRRYRIHQPRVCVTGGIQPSVLRRVLTEDFFERGLPARFLPAYPPMRQDKWSEVEVSDDLRAHVLELFEELWLLQPERDDHDQPRPKLLNLDSDAQAEYVRYYDECGASAVQADEHEEAAWSKLSGYAARLALVSQLVRNPHAETVTGEAMRAACDLARWFGKEAVRLYAGLAETQEQRKQRELCEFIERRGGAVYERDVMQSFTRLKNNKLGIERELTALVKDGRGKWEPVPTTERGGRPARKFHLFKLSTSTQPPALRGETRGSVDVDSASSQKNEASGEPEPAPERESPAGSVSVPLMMTKQMESNLLKMGYSQAEIDKMAPGEAWEKLGARRACPEAMGGVMEL